jgi:NAD(P)-dependent dehydrogenase (short-subunit alcohol dehydrogenase family)
VTGATGFVGYHVARKLADRGEVLCLARPNSDRRFLSQLKVRIVEGDLRGLRLRLGVGAALGTPLPNRMSLALDMGGLLLGLGVAESSASARNGFAPGD